MENESNSDCKALLSLVFELGIFIGSTVLVFVARQGFRNVSGVCATPSSDVARCT